MSIQNDGHATRISFAADSDVQFEEKEVTLPGVEGGGPIDTTTMANTTWRTAAAKQLKTLTESSCTIVYDAAFITEAYALLLVNTLIRIDLPHGGYFTFWGWLEAFTPKGNKEGEMPEADIKIHPSNRNASGVETGPQYTPPP